ncbi:DUF1289 domain-containing protein [Pseudomonas coleopterorum]|uniref:DUF1289 domain-containing protein n=1 Tax=Pseudomonas coleopterorum TaxID=1605838 RepID=UPI000F049296|nr:DUF1289 domain-containing protein [Pseudomonas coleopterorum]MBD8483013.1 DUF1289 domain-containing protein [Pseudomonas coleopterorum]MDY1018448.1 DUF1289 domain-containing protein [Pseudomonas coleopterorum]
MNPLAKPVKSPCISVCALDEDDVCTGCQRTAVEITQWGRMNDDQRRDVLRLAHERAVAQGLMLPGV